MTEENLKRGVKIQERLDLLKKNLYNIQRATKFYHGSVTVSGENVREDLRVEFIDFDTMKALTEKKIEREIKELEKEFKSL